MLMYEAEQMMLAVQGNVLLKICRGKGWFAGSASLSCGR